VAEIRKTADFSPPLRSNARETAGKSPRSPKKNAGDSDQYHDLTGIAVARNFFSALSCSTHTAFSTSRRPPAWRATTTGRSTRKASGATRGGATRPSASFRWARQKRTSGCTTCTSTLVFGESDLDVVLPMRRLTELAREGVFGAPAPSHYSVTGFILEPTELVEQTAPAIAERMRAERVDAAALVPA
jgi:hypothetical protein